MLIDVESLTSIIIYFSLAIVFYLPDKGIYFSDTYGGRFSEASLNGRWTGITPHPNSLGIFAAIGIVSLVILTTEGRRSLVRTVIPTLVYLIALLGSGSRTALITTVVSVFTYIIARYVLRLFEGGRFRFLMICGSGGIVLFCIVLMTVFTDLGTMLLDLGGRSSTLSGRTELWSLGIEAFVRKPLFGWGFDSFGTLKEYYGNIFRYNQFHNGLIDSLARGGIIGVFFVFLFLADYVLKMANLLEFRLRFPYAFLVLIFFILYNFAESSVFRYDDIVWMLLMVVWFTLTAQGGIGGNIPKRYVLERFPIRLHRNRRWR